MWTLTLQAVPVARGWQGEPVAGSGPLAGQCVYLLSGHFLTLGLGFGALVCSFRGPAPIPHLGLFLAPEVTAAGS